MFRVIGVYFNVGVCGVDGSLPKDSAPPPSNDPKHSENTNGSPWVI